MSPDLTTTDEIRAMFDRISPTYDRLNALLSFRLDSRWRRALAGSIPFTCARVLDCCTGTGELAFLLARQGHQVTGIDFSSSMLEIARKKNREAENPVFAQGDVEKLPFPDENFQVVASAFSLRNLKSIGKSFDEARRVLSPGGVLLLLDLTRPGSSWFLPLHRLYLTRVLPVLGGLISGYGKAYRYLGDSIMKFASPSMIAEMMRESGFSQITIHPLSGGIATLWTGRK